MKKVITIAAALFVAVAAQAATLQWGSEWVYSTQGQYDGVDPISGTCWLVLVGGSASTISVDNTGAITVGTGNTVLDSSAMNNWIYSDTINLAAATYNGLTVVMVGYDNVNQMYGVSGTWTISGLADSPAPNVVFHETFGNDGTYLQLNTAAVPEPTSMALLALGAAAFGLRRKFRK